MAVTLAIALTAAVIPLGVYYPHDLTDPSALTADLATFQAHGFTSLWVKGFSVDETLDISRKAAQHGMSVVAAIADLDIGKTAGDKQWWKRNAGYYDEWIRKVRHAWEFGSKLAGICLGDEPDGTLIGDYQLYLNTWRGVWPDHPPLTIVTTRGLIPAYYGLGFDVLTNDTYPFFAPGGAGYPDGPHQAFLRTCAENAKNGPAWGMGQGFGHRTFTPETPLRTPTPAEVSWQAYAAVATGCRGYVAFAWTYKPGSENFVSLAMPEMQKQLAALGVAYKRIAKWAPVITSTTFKGYTDILAGTGAIMARYAGSSGIYVMVVAGPDKPLSTRVPDVWLLADVENPRWPIAGWRKVSLQPGEGKLFKVVA